MAEMCNTSKRKLIEIEEIPNVKRLKILTIDAKLYTPSTLNIDFIQWHTQQNVCAVK